MKKQYKIIAVIAGIMVCLGGAYSFRDAVHSPTDGTIESSGARMEKSSTAKEGGGSLRAGQPDQRTPFYFANQRFQKNVERQWQNEDEAEESPAFTEQPGNPAWRNIKVTMREESVEEGEETAAPERKSIQEQAKELLGIDPKKVFGVDMDEKRAAIRHEMAMKSDLKLVELLRAQGIEPELIHQHMKIRQELKDKARRQPLGTKNYLIETGSED